MLTEDIKVIPTTKEDLELVSKLFEQAMKWQGKKGYKVWDRIDKTALEKDIENQLQYKILNGNLILCLFSVQYHDPFIWRDKDQDDALYLHRIVVDPNSKGQRHFQKVLDWAKQCARTKGLKFVRMDTWADNDKIIAYYKSFGFVFIENYTTTNDPELPIQNRNINVALLEVKLETYFL